ncbi:MAG TPA: hypothetical protein VG498_05165 [Terriglobales bacterium]|nr:hypothetical protein [Terriglobales bacterium]
MSLSRIATGGQSEAKAVKQGRTQRAETERALAFTAVNPAIERNRYLQILGSVWMRAKPQLAKNNRRIVSAMTQNGPLIPAQRHCTSASLKICIQELKKRGIFKDKHPTGSGGAYVAGKPARP